MFAQGEQRQPGLPRRHPGLERTPVARKPEEHVQAGIEAPTEDDDRKEVFCRAAIGKSYMEHVWGRAWTPMVELLAARELGSSAGTEWDVLPQLQVSLSTRQHILMNAGLRIPLTERSTRRASMLVYVLWDWFDGGFLSGW